MSIITRINKAEKRIVDLYNKLKNLPSGGGGVQTISGDFVDNTDPLNPILNDPRPYKVYTALLSQSGTDAPVATVLENTLGATITWSYVAVGQYIGTSMGTFTVNKTVIFSGSANDTDVATAMYIMALLGNENTVQIGTFNQLAVPTASDGKLTNTLIEIRVYN